jgi:hypothetical protein
VAIKDFCRYFLSSGPSSPNGRECKLGGYLTDQVGAKMQRLGQLVIGLVVAVFIFWIGWTSPSLKQCLQEAYYNNPQQPLQEYVTNLYGSFVGYRLCVGDFVHANGDGIIAIFTVILGIATWRLWLATRDLVSEARTAGEDQLSASSVLAAAAQKSADAAIESNKINLDNFIAMRRAWLSIEDAHLKHPTQFLEDAIIFCVDVTIKSFGQTPASSVWIDFESFFATNNMRHLLTLRDDSKINCVPVQWSGAKLFSRRIP